MLEDHPLIDIDVTFRTGSRTDGTEEPRQHVLHEQYHAVPEQYADAQGLLHIGRWLSQAVPSYESLPASDSRGVQRRHPRDMAEQAPAHFQQRFAARHWSVQADLPWNGPTGLARVSHHIDGLAASRFAAEKANGKLDICVEG